ncbi:MAG TPA: hypothetical protein VK789_10865 [Bryobacteraceae bacterium]|jgi:hypothetical protein|nr:hypothetical protein [Bryobacteraceae bacterium]
MKSIVNRLSLIAVTAAFLGTAAYGQDLKAGVPFGFRVPGGGITAGNYVIHMDWTGAGRVAHLYNVDTHKSVLAVSTSLASGSVREIQPRLVFQCSDEAGCALSEIWTPNGGYGVQIAKAHKYDYLATIPLTVQQGN